MTTTSLRSFRVVCKQDNIASACRFLQLQGFSFTPEPFHPFVFRLTHEPFPLGTSLAARFGLIYIQDRSSMLPPLALNPPPGGAVLDMCASPGSKTGFLGQLVGDKGFVLGNEPSRNRLATLRRNLSHLNLLQCATTSFPGESLPLPSASTTEETFGEGWPAILLDPPCSGWGTVEKNPQVTTLWQGEKVLPLIQLQQKLLQEASRLLRPGGRVVYSTCTTNVAENEEQVRFATDSLGLKQVPISPPPGFIFAEALLGLEGCLRVETRPEEALMEGCGENGQGFFVALFEKPSAGAENMLTSPLATATAFETLTRAALDSTPFVDASLLPPGDIAAINGTARFLPAQWRERIPQGFAWKGFSLGKVQPGGQVRVNQGLRCLMPSLQQAQAKGLPVLATEDTDILFKLLSGQSLTGDGTAKEVGLYFEDIPLCRLIQKGKRVMLPQL